MQNKYIKVHVKDMHIITMSVLKTQILKTHLSNFPGLKARKTLVCPAALSNLLSSRLSGKEYIPSIRKYT